MLLNDPGKMGQRYRDPGQMGDPGDGGIARDLGGTRGKKDPGGGRNKKDPGGVGRDLSYDPPVGW